MNFFNDERKRNRNRFNKNGYNLGMSGSADAEFEQFFGSLLSAMSQTVSSDFTPIPDSIANLNDSIFNERVSTDDFLMELMILINVGFEGKTIIGCDRKIQLSFPSGDTFEIKIAKL